MRTKTSNPTAGLTSKYEKVSNQNARTYRARVHPKAADSPVGKRFTDVCLHIMNQTYAKTSSHINI